MREVSRKKLAPPYQWADVWENKLAGESFSGTCSIHPGRRHQTRLCRATFATVWQTMGNRMGWFSRRCGLRFFVLWLKTLSMTQHDKLMIKRGEKNVEFLGRDCCWLLGNWSWPGNALINDILLISPLGFSHWFKKRGNVVIEELWIWTEPG